MDDLSAAFIALLAVSFLLFTVRVSSLQYRNLCGYLKAIGAGIFLLSHYGGTISHCPVTLKWWNNVLKQIGMSRRKEGERRVTAQRGGAQHAESLSSPSNIDSNSNNNNHDVIVKEFDLPPAYDEIVHSFTLNTQLTQNIPAGGPSGIPSSTSNTISASVSTLTIESEVSNSNNVSIGCLNNTIAQ